jgi:hypothetical protein
MPLLITAHECTGPPCACSRRRSHSSAVLAATLTGCDRACLVGLSLRCHYVHGAPCCSLRARRSVLSVLPRVKTNPKLANTRVDLGLRRVVHGLGDQRVA